MVQSAVVAQGDYAGVVDPVAAHAGVGLIARRAGGCGGLRSGEVGRVRGAPAQGAVRTLVVVVGGEPVEQGP